LLRPLALASQAEALPAWTPLISARGLPTWNAGVQTTTGGTGLSTCCPSGSLFSYPLGPTNSPRITRAVKPSDFRWRRFALRFCVTHPDIRTRDRSTVRLRDRFTAATTLPYHSRLARVPSVGGMLCPVELSAQEHSTSELLRTLSRVAASKPTSWLSVRSHNLCHSASTWGP
jgi:hypothetical protein